MKKNLLKVAVKCLSRERMQNSTLAFLKEYEIMQAMDHQNVVRLYGLVMEAQVSNTVPLLV